MHQLLFHCSYSVKCYNWLDAAKLLISFIVCLYWENTYTDHKINDVAIIL